MQATLIRDAAERALASRGTVMLGVLDDDRRWCCVCAAVDGCLEVRVAEPPRGWRSWRAGDGERWLRDHGWAHRTDAWVAPAPRGVGKQWCVATLQAALGGALQVPPDAELVELLSQPGLVEERGAPPPGAPHAEHIGHAIGSLVARGHGRVCFEIGRPAHPAAWVFAGSAGLTLSPERSSDAAEELPEWTVALEQAGVAEATRGLLDALARDGGHDPGDPLFIAVMEP